MSEDCSTSMMHNEASFVFFADEEAVEKLSRWMEHGAYAELEHENTKVEEESRVKESSERKNCEVREAVAVEKRGAEAVEAVHA